ncbi:hypothetical protein D7030_14085 [Flavobacteriaceae bacterium AU392]|nr:hypothetical protein D1817_04405 [Flavobacteriaceae bacterium]RKM81432.1 hypothetical protein D7030_14085 [Flavobacteriaceae bacterium AU392]
MNKNYLKKRLKYILLYIFCSIFFFVSSQDDNLKIDQFVNSFHELSNRKTPNQIYLQTSKDIYETGEDMWFKAYVLDSRYFTPSNLDKILYTQLLEEDTNKIVWQEKYEIENGFTNGHIYVNDSLTSGNYLLSVYTSHSFYKNTKKFYDTRRIIIKRNIDSKIIVKNSFNKKNYKKGDTLQLSLEILSKQEDNLYRAKIDAELWSNGEEVNHVIERSNKRGKALVNFILKKEIVNSKIKLKVVHKDKEEYINLLIPYNEDENIQFDVFPEGGNLISGLENNLAFKAVNEKGLPIDVKGILYENNKPLLELNSEHYGMGVFNFTPKVGHSYHIQLKNYSKDTIYSLPDIKEKGIQIQLKERNKDYLIFDISNNLEKPIQKIYTRVQVRGVVYNISPMLLKEKLRAKIPLKDLPQGIAEVTIFNENLLPIAERLVYVNQDKKLNIEVTPREGLYEKREKIILKIKVKDDNDNPIQGNFGLSVFDKIYEDENNKINILTYSYLRTQLKGKIYNPSFYFDEKNKNREKMLDLLMLTQGWRAYVWSESQLEGLDDSIDEYKKVVFNKLKGKIIIKGKEYQEEQFSLLIYDPVNESTSDFIFLNDKNEFRLENQQLKDAKGGYVYIKPLSSKAGSNDYNKKFKYKVKLEYPFQNINKNISNAEILYPILQIKTDKKIKLKPFKITSNTLVNEEVLLKGDNEIYRNKYLGKLDSLASVSTDYVCRYNIFNCVNHPKGTRGTRKAEIGETYHLNNGGLVKYSGSKSKFTEEDLLRKFNLTQVKGYYKTREFYQPNYDKESDPFPDSRNTLLWKPDIITDEKGEAVVSFFCSDVNAKFIGNIEGIDNNGLLGSKSFEFVVKK